MQEAPSSRPIGQMIWEKLTAYEPVDAENLHKQAVDAIKNADEKTDIMGNDLAKKAMKKMDLALEGELYGADNFVYSYWNFSNPKTVKFSGFYWFEVIVKFLKIILDSYKFVSAVNGRYNFYSQGRNMCKVLWQVPAFIEKMTHWTMFEGMKPWYRYAGKIPKPDNYAELENRPTTWAAHKKAKGTKDKYIEKKN